MNNLKIKILETVQKNNIKMIPKWKFVLYSSLGIVGIIFAFLLAVFTGSLILFVLSRYGFLDLPFFEFMGTLHALSAIPFLLLGITVLLLIIIEVISRNYTFSFRRPLGITLLAITSVTVLISFAISKTSIHETVRNYARDHHFDMMTRAYDRPRPFKGENGMTVLRGRVMEAASTTIVVELFDGVSKSAFVSSTSEVFTIPTVGSDVVMVGKIVDERFYISKMRTILPGQEKGRRGPMPPFFDDMRGVSPSKNSF